MAEPIEAIIIQYLNEYHGLIDAGIHTYPQEPVNPNPTTSPEKFIVVQKTGSSRSNHIYSSMVAVQSYAPTLYEAAQLNEIIIEAMDNLVTLDRVTGVDLNATYPFTKTATKQPRYQAVFDLTHY